MDVTRKQFSNLDPEVSPFGGPAMVDEYRHDGGIWQLLPEASHHRSG